MLSGSWRNTCELFRAEPQTCVDHAARFQTGTFFRRPKARRNIVMTVFSFYARLTNGEDGDGRTEIGGPAITSPPIRFIQAHPDEIA